MKKLLCLFIAAVLVVLAAAPAAAIVVRPLDEKTLVVELTSQGPTRQEAVHAAMLEAVAASVGRVFMSEQLILADELLSKYLTNYAQNFVNAVEVTEEKFFEGRNIINSRVFVDQERLFKDLEEKKFLYRPAYKPRFASFMTERLDGRIATEGTARDALATSLNNLGLRRYQGELPTPPATTDVSQDEFLLNAAIVSSQRSGVEVIIAGETRTRQIDRRKLYFDEYFFYDTEMTASLVRVDTGEILFTANGNGTASAKEQREASETSIRRAGEQVAAELMRRYEGYWPTVVQQRSNYQLLLTGVDGELLRIVMQNIERMGRGTKVYLRKSYGPSAVIQIVTTGSRDDLLENLTSTTYPTLYILNPESERAFEVQVSS